MIENKYTYEDFLEIVAKLRAKDGCPWDRIQTHESLRSCMIEEAYEAADAIDNKDADNLQEELGDVLLQVVMHAQIAKEEGIFDMTDVVHGVSEKMVRRHPHIFGDATVNDSGEVVQNWEAIKKAEKGEKTAMEGILRVPKALPANIRAAKVLKKAEAAGWDFGGVNNILENVSETLENVRKKVTMNTDAGLPEEAKSELEIALGQLLLGVVNLSRILGTNPENCLTNAIETFINRFGCITENKPGD